MNAALRALNSSVDLCFQLKSLVVVSVSVDIFLPCTVVGPDELGIEVETSAIVRCMRDSIHPTLDKLRLSAPMIFLYCFRPIAHLAEVCYICVCDHVAPSFLPLVVLANPVLLLQG